MEVGPCRQELAEVVMELLRRARRRRQEVRADECREPLAIGRAMSTGASVARSAAAPLMSCRHIGSPSLAARERGTCSRATRMPSSLASTAHLNAKEGGVPVAPRPLVAGSDSITTPTTHPVLGVSFSLRHSAEAKRCSGRTATAACTSGGATGVGCGSVLERRVEACHRAEPLQMSAKRRQSL
jgi:hypothetical protein